LVPRPNVAFLLDAEPAQARARKPEYPLDFLNDNRAQYMALAKFTGMTVVKPLAVKDVKRTVIEEVSAALSHAQANNTSGGRPIFTADLTSKLG
jgi:hypothetical protein